LFSPIMVNWALPPDLRSSATVPPPPWVYVPSTFDFEPQLTTPKTSNARLRTFAILGKKELFMWCSDFVKARTFVRCAAFCQATLFGHQECEEKAKEFIDQGADVLRR